MTDTPTHKVCLSCEVNLPLTDFSPMPSGKLRRAARCRPCAKARRKRKPPPSYCKPQTPAPVVKKPWWQVRDLSPNEQGACRREAANGWLARRACRGRKPPPALTQVMDEGRRLAQSRRAQERRDYFRTDPSKVPNQ